MQLLSLIILLDQKLWYSVSAYWPITCTIHLALICVPVYIIGYEYELLSGRQITDLIFGPFTILI